MLDTETIPQDALTEGQPAAEGAVADATTPETTTGEPAPAPEKTRAERIRELLDEADGNDLEEIVRHKRIEGKVGQVADKLEAQRQKDREARAERERLLEAARNNDLLTVGEHAARRLLEDDSSQAEQQRATQVVKQVHEHVTQWAAKLPPEVTKALDGKAYDGTYEQGLVAYVDDVATGLVAHRLNAAVEQEIEKRLPAIRARLLAEVNGAEPTPDLASGAPAGTGGKQYATYAQASEALMAGSISVADMRALVARNGWR